MTETENVISDQQPPIIEERKLNPLIERVKIPGEVFAIPSGGIFYTHEELDDSVENGEVHVHPMSAYDEIVIKTPSLLLNGKAVEEVFKRCIPEIHKPMNLLAKDVDFLLVALRQVTFGNLMDINYTHTCKDAKEHGYQADLSKFISQAKKINPTTVGKNYTIMLENKGVSQKVELRPARYKEIVDMLQLYAFEEEIADDHTFNKAQNETKSILKSISSIIRSVDGLEDEDIIFEWLEFIQAGWIEKLTAAVEKTSNWGPKFEHKDKCKDCGKVITISVPINPISFFT